MTRFQSSSISHICDIPTYDGSGECTHPSVIDSVATLGYPWYGYRYWMAFTPYPGNNARRFRLENPSIVASDDGTRWVIPPGVRNPIVPAPGLLDLGRSLTYGMPTRRSLQHIRGTLLRLSFNADPALYLSRDGNMAMAYVHSLKGTGHDELVVVESADGWRSVRRRGILVRSYQEPDTYEVNVPSIIETGDTTVHLYYGYVPADDRGRPHYDRVGIRRRSGTSFDSLGAATTISIKYPSGQRLWHHEVRRHPSGKIICLGTFAPDTGSKHSMTWPPTLSLYYGVFTDDDTLTFDDHPVLRPSVDGWDSQCIYKPSFLVRAGAGGDTIRLWYSAQQARSSRWRIGIVERNTF